MIYLDNAATTKPDEEALGRATAYAKENFYNPSALYGGGLLVHTAVKEAREALLSKIAGSGFELVFTSCGTESDNHAILCSARRGNALTTLGEHAAVYQSYVALKNRGVETRFAPLNMDGSVKEEALLSLVDDRTTLVSVVHVNNETGAVNDIIDLAQKVKQKNPRCIFHSDGVQAFGKLSIRLTDAIDLYSVSAHKIGGIKGTGALIKRKRLALGPLIFGGGQEGNLRSGTENVLGILCFRFAAEKKFASLQEDLDRISTLREKMWRLLQTEFIRISPEDGSPYILTVAARGLRGEILQRLAEGRGVIVGTGSACSSKKPYSRVIEACGYDREVLGGVLRVSFSCSTTEAETLFAANALLESVRELKGKL